MLINRTNLDFLFQTWDARFEAAFQAPRTYQELYATMMPSASRATVHSWLEAQEGLREWIGARQVDNAVARDYTLVNKTFEKTIGLEREKVADDTYGVFGPVVDTLGVQSKLWPDDVMTTIVEQGHVNLCWDGQPFFSDAHPVDFTDASKGTFSNLVDADFGADPIAAYDAACTQMGEILGADGRPHDTVPDLIMGPVRKKKQMLQVANAELTAQAIKNVAGNENVAGAGVSNVFQGSITTLVNTRLRDPEAVYLLKAAGPIKPFIWQLRQATQLAALNSPTDANVFMEKKFLYGVDGRGAGGYSLPWLCMKIKTIP